MGFYAAPLGNSASAELPSGYTPPAGYPQTSTVISDGDYLYRAPLGYDASATLEAGYEPPLPLDLSPTLLRPLSGLISLVFAPGFTDEHVYSPRLIQHQLIRHQGIDLLDLGLPAAKNYSWFIGVQHIPGALRASAELQSGYAPPSASIATLRRYGDDLVIGLPAVETKNRKIYPKSWDGHAFGHQSVRHAITWLYPAGWISYGSGWAFLEDNAKRPVGFDAQVFGRPLIYNLLQFVRALSWGASSYGGDAYVSGGVKLVRPTGALSASFGTSSLLNTTANRLIQPIGFATMGVGNHNVSPRILFPLGISAWRIGAPQVQRNPASLGFDSAVFGLAAIEDKTKYLGPLGINHLGVGFPVAYDPTRKIFPSSVVGVGIFGDTRIKNTAARVVVAGFDSFELSPWAQVENNRRSVAARGVLSEAFGSSYAANKTPSISPAGIGSLRVGSASAGYRLRKISVSGIPNPGFGSNTLTKTPEIAPSGFFGAIGVPTIWFSKRLIEASGANTQILPLPTAWFRFRFVRPSGFGSFQFGNSKTEHGRRHLLALGSQNDAYGRPLVTNADRVVAPPSIYLLFATGHMVGGSRFLRPVGFDAARFGSRVIPEIQQSYPVGFDGSYGRPDVRNRTSLIRPTSITTGIQPADRWGTAMAFNLRQYVAMIFDPDSGLNPPQWPQWTLVFNRTRRIVTVGQQAARFGETSINNNAITITPLGVTAPSPPPSYKAGMVAYRVRSFLLQGVEPPYISPWAAVRNDAAVARATGFNTAKFGNCAASNTRRYFPWIGGFDAAWLGYPMVAERIRRLEFEGRYTIGAPPIPGPIIKLYTRYIDALGQDMSRIGSPSLVIFRAMITPRWSHRDLFGEPIAINVTPEVRTRGRASDEFGDAFIRLEWRAVELNGYGAQLFGRSEIAFRDRYMPVAGINAGAVGAGLTVVKAGAPPYSTQNITLDRDETESGKPDGDGIWPPGGRINNIQVPRPIINQQVVYVMQDLPHTLFGDARLTADGIRVEPGFKGMSIGDHFVALKIRTLAVGEWPSSEVFEPSKARVSPHTIYAVMDAPAQAVINHPSVLRRHYVDGYTREAGAIFGKADVMLRNRRISAYGDNESTVARPSITNRSKYLNIAGWVSLRFGWHTVPGPQAVVQFDSASHSIVGVPAVARPPYIGPITLSLKGFNAHGPSCPSIELLNRHIRPDGYKAELMGEKKYNDSPYQWQGLRVGPLVPTMPVGASMQAMGVPWISFRVRGIGLAGFDAFLSEYDLMNFAKRMRVIRQQLPRPFVSIAPVGFAAFASAASNVRHGIHYIRPDGNADQYRKGAF